MLSCLAARAGGADVPGGGSYPKLGKAADGPPLRHGVAFASAGNKKAIQVSKCVDEEEEEEEEETDDEEEEEEETDEEEKGEEEEEEAEGQTSGELPVPEVSSGAATRLPWSVDEMGAVHARDMGGVSTCAAAQRGHLCHAQTGKATHLRRPGCCVPSPCDDM